MIQKHHVEHVLRPCAWIAHLVETFIASHLWQVGQTQRLIVTTQIIIVRITQGL
jgi:hypothetical protein